MAKAGKILGIAVAGAVAIIVVGFVLAKLFITPERVRSTVVPLAEKSLQRQVRLGDIEISLFSGIVLKDLKIADKNGTDSFVSADRVLLRYQFWPLLSKKVIVDEVRFDSPRIRIVRLADNSFNFSDLIKTREKGSEEVAPATKTTGEGIDLLVSEVSVSHGALLFIDQGVKKGATQETTLKDLSFSATDISLDNKFPCSLETSVNDAPIRIKATIDPQQQSAAAVIVAKEIDIVRFSPYFADKVPGKLDRLRCSLDLQLAASPKSLSSKGTITLEKIDLALDALQDAPFTNASLQLTHDLKLDISNALLDLNSSDIRLNAIPLQLSGRVEKLFDKPILDLLAEVKALELSEALASLPAKLVEPAAPFEPKGKVSVRIKLAGGVEEPRQLPREGEIKLDSIQTTVQGLRSSISGMLSLREGTLATSDLTVRTADQQINIRGSVKKIFSEPFNPLMEADITAQGLDLARITASLPDKTKGGFADLQPAGIADLQLTLSGPLKEPMKLLQKGKVTLQGVGVRIAGLQPQTSGTITLNAGAAQTDDLLIRIGEDTISVKARVADLHSKPIKIKNTITAERLNIDRLLQNTDNEKKAAAGKEKPPATTTAEEPEPLDLPIVAEGSANVKQALYKGLAVNDFVCRYRLADNKLQIEELTGKSANGSFASSGTVDLGKKGYAYKGDVKVKEMQADQFVAAFVPKMNGMVFGALNLDLDLNGSGITSENLKKNLSGNGDLLVTDGKITGAGLAQGLAAFLDLEQLRVLRFSKFNGSLKLAGGQVLLQSDVSGNDLRMTPRGTVGLDGAIDMSLDTRLAPPLTAKLGSGKVTQFLTDEQGWAQLPLKITGMANAPHFVLDTSMVTRKLQEKATQTLQQKLQERLFESVAPQPKATEPQQPPSGVNGDGTAVQPQQSQETTQPAAPPSPPQEEPGKELLKKTLRGIFNR